MPIIQTYYPLRSGNPLKLILERNNNVFQYRLQRSGNPWTNWPIPVLSPHPTRRLQWRTIDTAIFTPHRIILTSGRRGFCIHEINRNGLDLSNVTLNPVEGNLCQPTVRAANPQMVTTNWRNTISHDTFARELHHHYSALSLRFVSTAAIVVAVGTGIVMSIGFGPAAGMSGLSSSLGSSTAGATVASSVIRDRLLNAAASGISSGIVRLISESFNEMTRIAGATAESRQIDTQRNATRFWENNRNAIERIVALSLTDAAFNVGTSFIPTPSITQLVGPGRDLTMRVLAWAIGQRFAQNLIGVVGNILEDHAQGNEITWERYQRNIIRPFIVRALG